MAGINKGAWQGIPSYSGNNKGAWYGVNTTTTTAAPTTTNAPSSGQTIIALVPSGILTGKGYISGSSVINLTPAFNEAALGYISGSTTINLTPAFSKAAFGYISGNTSIVLTPIFEGVTYGFISGSSKITLIPSFKESALGYISGDSKLALIPSGALCSPGYLSGRAKIGLASSGSSAAGGNVAGLAAISLAATGTLSCTGYISGTTTLDLSTTGALSSIGNVSGAAKMGLSLSGSLCAIGYSIFPVMGVKYYIPVTVNHTQVAESDTNFLYQWDLSSYLSDANFKAEISGSQNVTVYDPVTMFLKAKTVKVDLTGNKLLVYHDGPKSTTVDKVFYVCVGAGLNVINSASAFTNSGISNFWGFDEFANESTTLDSAGSRNGTVVSPATIGNTGKFGNAAKFTGSAGFSTDVITTNLTGQFPPITFECVFNANSMGYTGYGRLASCGFTNWVVFIYGGSIGVYSVGNSVVIGGIGTGAWYHAAITYNSDKSVSVYINGVYRGGGAIITLPTTSALVRLGNCASTNAAFDGLIDQISIKTSVSSVSAMDRYKLLFTPGTFATFGNITEQEAYAHINITASGVISAIGNITGSTDINVSASGPLSAKGYISGAAKIGLRSTGTASIQGIVYGGTEIALTSTGNVSALGHISGSAKIGLVFLSIVSAQGVISGSIKIGMHFSSVLMAKESIGGHSLINAMSSGLLSANGYVSGHCDIILAVTGVVSIAAPSSGQTYIKIIASGMLVGKSGLAGGSRISIVAGYVLSALGYIKGNGYIVISGSGGTGYDETGKVHLVTLEKNTRIVRLERRYRDSLIEEQRREITC